MIVPISLQHKLKGRDIEILFEKDELYWQIFKPLLAPVFTCVS